jgi:hypothetical protein
MSCGGALALTMSQAVTPLGWKKNSGSKPALCAALETVIRMFCPIQLWYSVGRSYRLQSVSCCFGLSVELAIKATSITITRLMCSIAELAIVCWKQGSQKISLQSHFRLLYCPHMLTFTARSSHFHYRISILFTSRNAQEVLCRS